MSLPGGMNYLDLLNVFMGLGSATEERYQQQEAERKNKELMNQSLNFQAANAQNQYGGLASQYGSALDFFLGPTQQQSRTGAQSYQPRSLRGSTETRSPTQRAQQATSQAAGDTNTDQALWRPGAIAGNLLGGLAGLLGGGGQSSPAAQQAAKQTDQERMLGGTASDSGGSQPTNVSRSSQQQTNLQQSQAAAAAAPTGQQGMWNYPGMSAFYGGGQPLFAGTDPMPLGPEGEWPAAVGENAENRTGGYFDQALKSLSDVYSGDLSRYKDYASSVLGTLDTDTQQLKDTMTAGNEGVMSGWGNLKGDVMGGVGDLQSSLQGGYGQRIQDVLGSLGKDYKSALGDLTGLRSRAMGNLEGMGDQERRDIEQSYGQRDSDIRQQLASSGMGNTTIGATMGLGTEREKRADLGRLEERLRNQKIDLDTSLTQAQSAARERMGSSYADAMAQLSGQGLSSQEAMGQFGAGMESQLGTSALGAQRGLNESAMSLLSGLSDRGLSYLDKYGGESVDRAMTAAMGTHDQWSENELSKYGLQEDFYNKLLQMQDQSTGNYLNTLANIQVPYPSGEAQAGFTEYLQNLSSESKALRAADKQASATKQAAWTSGLLGLGGSAMPRYTY